MPDRGIWKSLKLPLLWVMIVLMIASALSVRPPGDGRPPTVRGQPLKHLVSQSGYDPGAVETEWSDQASRTERTPDEDAAGAGTILARVLVGILVCVMILVLSSALSLLLQPDEESVSARTTGP